MPRIEGLTVAEFETKLYRTVAERGSHAFLPLTEPVLLGCFEAMLDALLAGDIAGTELPLAELHRSGVPACLLRIRDVTGQPVIGLMEGVGPGTQGYRGWGAVLVRPGDAGDRIYQAPHVKADLYTASITLRAFLEDRRGSAAVFAGAHRYANGRKRPVADVAHGTENLFHGLTVYLARRGQATGRPFWFIQFHGSRDRPGQPVITASNGAAMPALTTACALVRIQAAVGREGCLKMGVCGWTDGSQSDQAGSYLLTARDNIQGQFLESIGLREHFMHFEIGYEARRQYHAGHEPGKSGILHLLEAIRQTLRDSA